MKKLRGVYIPDQRVSYKLNGKQQIEVCKMLALGYGCEAVVQELKALYDIEVTRQNIFHNYKQKKRKFIESLRDKIEAKVMHHPALKKSFRLNTLFKAIQIALGDKHQSKAISQLIRELRIEAEGEKPLVNIERLSVLSQMYEIAMNGNGHPKRDG